MLCAIDRLCYVRLSGQLVFMNYTLTIDSRYLYKAMASPALYNPATLLQWHEKVTLNALLINLFLDCRSGWCRMCSQMSDMPIFHLINQKYFGNVY